MSNDATIHECESEIDHYTGHYLPYSLRRVCGLFKVPQIFLLNVQELVRRGLQFIVLYHQLKYCIDAKTSCRFIMLVDERFLCSSMFLHVITLQLN